MSLDQPSKTASDSHPLSDAEAGVVFEVCRIQAGDEDTIRLKRMGICEGRQVQLEQAGDPLILRVVGCRIGLSRRLASQVQVAPCTSCWDLRVDKDA